MKKTNLISLFSLIITCLTISFVIQSCNGDEFYEDNTNGMPRLRSSNEGGDGGGVGQEYTNKVVLQTETQKIVETRTIRRCSGTGYWSLKSISGETYCTAGVNYEVYVPVISRVYYKRENANCQWQLDKTDRYFTSCEHKKGSIEVKYISKPGETCKQIKVKFTGAHPQFSCSGGYIHAPEDVTISI